MKGADVEAAILRFQEQVRGKAPEEDIVAIDGKEARRSRGQQILTAVTAGSLHYLGSLPVSDKTNERRGFLLVTSKQCRLTGKNE